MSGENAKVPVGRLLNEQPLACRSIRRLSGVRFLIARRFGVSAQQTSASDFTSPNVEVARRSDSYAGRVWATSKHSPTRIELLTLFAILSDLPTRGR